MTFLTFDSKRLYSWTQVSIRFQLDTLEASGQVVSEFSCRNIELSYLRLKFLVMYKEQNADIETNQGINRKIKKVNVNVNKLSWECHTWRYKLS